MTLYGALFTGVSGLKSQGQKIGIISDNIANVNTEGYKRGEAKFQTLVVNSAGAGAYNPGGVRSETRYHIEQQGLLASTEAPTDLAISGQGFFVVSQNADGAGQTFYTRAGSFRRDDAGNFVNAQGFYLQAWPLDRDGRLPGEPGNVNTISFANLESLETVNVESASGEAEGTTDIQLGINLKADEVIFQGETLTLEMDSNSTPNYQITGDDIIVPDESSTVVPPPDFGLATTNHIRRGDSVTVTTGDGFTYDYEYGGFTIGRDITLANTANIGDAQNDLTPNQLAVGGEIVVAMASNVFTVTTAVAHGLTSGDEVLIDNFTFAGGLGNVPLAEINTIHTVTVLGASTFTFTTTTTNTGGADSNAALPVTTWSTRLFAGNILDADTVNELLINPSDLSDYTGNARSFTITTASGGPATFTYKTDSPSASGGQFNTLSNLAEAIDANTSLTARLVGGRLVVGSQDATEAVTFANVDDVGTATLRGIDWVTELDVSNVSGTARRFSTLNNLAILINEDTGVSAQVNDPTTEATLDLWVDNPLETIQVTDTIQPAQPLAVNSFGSIAGGGPGAVTVQITLNGHGLAVGDNIAISNMTPFNGFTATELNTVHTITNVIDANNFEVVISTVAVVAAGQVNTDGEIANTNRGSLVAELGIHDDEGTLLVSSLLGGAFVYGDTGTVGPRYDATGVLGDNLASEAITPQFIRPVTIYDDLGESHDIKFAFIKVDLNMWAVEVYADPADQISTLLTDGQIATGTIEFNGDGTLKSVSSGLSGPITVNWTNGAEPSEVTLDLGTAGLPFGTPNTTTFGDSDGMRQFAGEYTVFYVTQDGAPVGLLLGVTVDEEGFIVASFTNGQNKQLFKIPIADFVNPNGLQPVTGNAYAQTNDSGDFILRQAGENGIGTVVSGALEQSNVDLANELTEMIVAQRSYQANTRVISTSNDLLEQLNQL